MFQLFFAAPAIFQWTMEAILQGLPYTCVYIDDIIVSKNKRRTSTEPLSHLQTIESSGYSVEVAEMCIYGTEDQIPGRRDLCKRINTVK